jgi:hypothetical protein
MPRGSRAFFPVEVRTARGPESSRTADALMGFLGASPERSSPDRRDGFPSLSLLCFLLFVPKNEGARHSRALPIRRVGEPEGPPSSLEVSYQDPPSTLVRRQ